ncbi:MAG: DUF6065 family protein [Hyphomicrobiaceae bacterium]
MRAIQMASMGRLPRRADRSVGGTLPARAMRYCEPVSAASAFGWYFFVPCRFQLRWDGSEVFWRTQGMDAFEPLRSVHLPGFPKAFDEAVPEAIKGWAPPFLVASPQSGVVKVWTGAVARTAPGWNLLVRPVANLPRRSGYELYEGLLETDDFWFGPLFTNVRLTRTDMPIEFDDDVPFMQVQPIRAEQYQDRLLDNYAVVTDLAELSEDDWTRYVATVIEPNRAERRKPARYKAAVQAARLKRDCSDAG